MGRDYPNWDIRYYVIEVLFLDAIMQCYFSMKLVDILTRLEPHLETHIISVFQIFLVE